MAETIYDMLEPGGALALIVHTVTARARPPGPGRLRAPHLFGDRLDDFARDVRGLLANRSAEGIFWDWPGGRPPQPLPKPPDAYEK